MTAEPEYAEDYPEDEAPAAQDQESDTETTAVEHQDEVAGEDRNPR